MDYKQKYLKYKLKYLNAKKLYGGMQGCPPDAKSELIKENKSLQEHLTSIEKEEREKNKPVKFEDLMDFSAHSVAVGATSDTEAPETIPEEGEGGPERRAARERRKKFNEGLKIIMVPPSTLNLSDLKKQNKSLKKHINCIREKREYQKKHPMIVEEEPRPVEFDLSDVMAFSEPPVALGAISHSRDPTHEERSVIGPGEVSTAETNPLGEQIVAMGFSDYDGSLYGEARDDEASLLKIQQGLAQRRAEEQRVARGSASEGPQGFNHDLFSINSYNPQCSEASLNQEALAQRRSTHGRAE